MHVPMIVVMQVHPVVSRLVAVLEGTDASRIAECLGLDPSRYRGGSGGGGSHGQGDAEGDGMGWVLVDDEQAFKVGGGIRCVSKSLITPTATTTITVTAPDQHSLLPVACLDAAAVCSADAHCAGRGRRVSV